MKKLISILLMLCMLFTLMGCNQTSGQETESSSTTDAAPQDSTAASTDFVPVQETMVAISVPATTESVTADDGTVIFNYIHQTPFLTLSDPDVVDMITIDFLERVDATRSDANALLESAKANYSGAADWTPYLYQMTYNPTRIDHGVLSFFGLNVRYSGASHPEQTCRAASYDLLTGDVLTLASIMSADSSVDDFCQLVLENLAAQKEDLSLYDFYADVVKQRFATEASQDENFYFSQTGLCFYFEPLEIAPYSSGVIHVEIPYENLGGLLYDGYFPDEQDIVSGIVQAHRSGDIDTEQFTQIAEVTIDRGGEMVFLHTDTSVRNVRIEVGSWDEFGIAFTPSYTAFATPALTPGDAVMVETYIPDTMPNLRLTYQSGDETIAVYISQSGEDGSILLLDD